jgi:hypothetical protein
MAWEICSVITIYLFCRRSSQNVTMLYILTFGYENTKHWDAVRLCMYRVTVTRFLALSINRLWTILGR